MANFDTAIQTLLVHEGGLVNDPSDAGGCTNWGISSRDNPDLDVASMTQDDAIAYYKADWWDKYHFDDINDDDLATYYFDHAVNTGIHAVTVAVQQVVGAIVDGQIGPHTIAVINQNYTPDMMSKVQDTLWQHYLKILAAHPEDEKFRKGWYSRCYSV